jgi:hypothetical protein
MSFIMIFLLAAIQLICLWLLWLSCFPGALVDGLWLPIILLYLVLTQYVAVLTLVALLVLGWAIWLRSRPRNQSASRSTGKTRLRSIKKRLIWMTGGMMICTLLLIGLNLPQKIAFSLSRPAFDAFIADSVKVDQTCGRSMKQQFGFYQVEECDRDPKGGIYLKTGQYDFLNSIAYGFVHRPNPKGSTYFGKDIYEYHAVINEWNWFKAGNDW